MSRRLPLLLLAAAAILYFVDLSGSSIWDANEAFYVETPREMIERGDYISPTFNYEPRLNKPVLSYWIVAVSYHLFGISVGVQRLPIAIGGIVVILTAFVLGRAASTATQRSDTTLAGVWAALGLAISPRLMMFARRIFIDIYISMFMALTLLFFALSERYPERRRLFLVLMYASVGLGVLTKGPVAAALPALMFAIYLLVHGELRRIREMMLPAGTLIALAIVAPWYIALYLRHGWTYIVSFFMTENIGRYTEGVGPDANRGPLFYVPVVFSDSFPWSFLLLAAAGFWWSCRRDLGCRALPAFRVQTLLFIWTLGIVVFFSFSATKQDLYIFPIVPAVAALAGAYITASLQQPKERRLALRVTAATMAVFIGVAAAGVLYLFEGAGAIYDVDGVRIIGVAGLTGAVSALVLAVMARPGAALLTLCATLLCLDWTFVLRVLPSFEAYKPSSALADRIRQLAGANDIVAHYDVAMPSMVYYLRRHIVEIEGNRQQLVEMLRSDRKVYAVMATDAYPAVRDEAGVQTCVVTHRPTFEVKLRNILARDPLPQLLLITNDCGRERSSNRRRAAASPTDVP